VRGFATQKIIAPPMVYISGEEMTHYTMNLILEQWIKPNVDTSNWEFYDLSCKSRDDTEDRVLHDAVAAGQKLRSIFKEPTITPTQVQKELLGLKKTWGSPNGAMRRGWNGITISRDTIHIEGVKLGYDKPVLFERQAVGGEYSAGYGSVGKGRVVTMFLSDDEGSQPRIIDSRTLTDEESAVVTYDNPLDGVVDLAHHFFKRCLAGGVVPYVVTKKTVFKWQEGFWTRHKEVFDEHYKEDFLKAGLLDGCGGELQHLISDAATMQILRWTGGGFGMSAHNYDGDMLTDEISQVHRSPGFITSNLVGKTDDGQLIKEYEASHGTVADMWESHLRGEETSLNPLGMVEALVDAMQFSAEVHQEGAEQERTIAFAEEIRNCVHGAMAKGHGTRDLCGPEGLSTEDFVELVGKKLKGVVQLPDVDGEFVPIAKVEVTDGVRDLFQQLDTDGSGEIDINEFALALKRLGMEPKDMGTILASAEKSEAKADLKARRELKE
jgi:isocitrate dehydrogenase